MAETLEVLSHRIDTLVSIRGIVHTMKNLSVINALPYERAAQAIEAYHQTVLEGFRAFLHRNGAITPTSKPATTLVVVVFGSDHGLCGGYNETLATEVSSYLQTRRPETDAIQVLCVGARMNDALLGHDIQPQSTLLPAASADGIGRLAVVLGQLLQDIAHQSTREEAAVVLAFTERTAEGRQAAVLRELLPLDSRFIDGLAAQPWVSRSLPDFTLPAGDLFAELVSAHLFASMFRASTEALLTENDARLALMQQAEQSIDERLEEMKSEERNVRQTEITTELLDVIAGFEALKKSNKKSAVASPVASTQQD